MFIFYTLSYIRFEVVRKIVLIICYEGEVKQIRLGSEITKINSIAREAWGDAPSPPPKQMVKKLIV